MNNAAQQLRVADNLTDLWTGLLPDYPAPTRAQFLEWAGMASEEIASHAVNRAARKARREQQQTRVPMTAERLGRYVTGIVRNEREGRHNFTTPSVAA